MYVHRKYIIYGVLILWHPQYLYGKSEHFQQGEQIIFKDFQKVSFKKAFQIIFIFFRLNKNSHRSNAEAPSLKFLVMVCLHWISWVSNDATSFAYSSRWKTLPIIRSAEEFLLNFQLHQRLAFSLFEVFSCFLAIGGALNSAPTDPVSSSKASSLPCRKKCPLKIVGSCLMWVSWCKWQ